MARQLAGQHTSVLKRIGPFKSRNITRLGRKDSPRRHGPEALMKRAPPEAMADRLSSGQEVAFGFQQRREIGRGDADVAGGRSDLALMCLQGIKKESADRPEAAVPLSYFQTPWGIWAAAAWLEDALGYNWWQFVTRQV